MPDVGLQVFLAKAEGAAVENPRHYRRTAKALVTVQKRLSRRKKRGKRGWKAARLVAGKHQTVRRQRRDVHLMTALALVCHLNVLCLADLSAANLVRSHCRSKSISDAGWGQFRAILVCKAAWDGKRAVW